jgi:hypothetical protein
MAVSVKGGIASRPSFVIGIDRPHMTASNSIAARLLTEKDRAGTAMGERTAELVVFCVIGGFT